jgi:CHAT domain-containing protein
MALAERYAGDALRIHRAAGVRVSELSDLLLLAQLSSGGRDPVRAERYFAEARRMADILDTRPARVAVALGEAQAADARGDPHRVLSVLDDGEVDLTSAGYDEQGEAAALRARALAGLGLLDSAAVVGRQAVSAVERARGDQGSGFLRTTYLADRGRAYSDLVSVLLRLGREDEAFEFADAARGRALLEHLTSTIGGASPSNPTTRALAQGEELLRRIDALVARLGEAASEGGDDPANARIRQELSTRLAATRSEYEDLMARTSDRDAGAAAFLGGTHVRASDVAGALQSDEALLEYLVTSDAVVLFVVRAGIIRSFICDISPANLASRVRLAGDLLRRRGTASPDDISSHVLTALYSALLDPARRAGVLGGVRRLVIVPHQALVYLPFAALRDGGAGRFLVQDYSLLHLPSAAALPLLRRGEPGSQGSAEETRGFVFAPFPEALPATVSEAQAFKRIVPDSRMYVGARATETRLREALTGTGLVHVASHATLNPGNPMFSQVQLEPGAAGSPEDDGRLEVHELLGISIASGLVYLSGCETGLGSAWSTSFARGDDYATLAQAFLHAGARNVVATLWPVEDEGAAAFAKRFYQELAGLPPPEAMAQAQRALIADATYGAPYYWAGYAVSGAGGLRAASPRQMAPEKSAQDARATT